MLPLRTREARGVDDTASKHDDGYGFGETLRADDVAAKRPAGVDPSRNSSPTAPRADSSPPTPAVDAPHDAASDSPARTPASPAAGRRSRWWRCGCIGCVVVVLLPLLALLGARLYFNDEAIRSLVVEGMAEKTGATVRIEDLSLSLWRGRCIIQSLELIEPGGQSTATGEAGAGSGAGTDASVGDGAGAAGPRGETLLRVDRVEVAFSTLAAIASGGTSVGDLELSVEGATATVRALPDGTDGAKRTTWSALLARLRTDDDQPEEPSSFRLGVLHASLRNVALRYIGPDGRAAEASLPTLAFDHEGDPGVAQVAGTLAVAVRDAPQAAFTTAGSLELDGQVSGIPDLAHLAPEALRRIRAEATLQALDWARLAGVLGLDPALPVEGGRWVPGGPLSGGARVQGDRLDELSVEADLHAAPLARLETSAGGRLDFLPLAVRVEGRADCAGVAPRVLEARFDLSAPRRGSKDGRPATDGERSAIQIVGAMQQDDEGGMGLEWRGHADMGAILDTPAARALDLGGSMGGAMRLTGALRLDAGGASVKLETDGESTWIALGQARQPINLRARLDGAVLGTPTAGISEIRAQGEAKVDGFSLVTETPLVLTGVNQPGGLRGEGAFAIDIDGETLWARFEPLMRLLGLRDPIRERVAGQARIHTEGDAIRLAADVTAARQRGPKSPLRMRVEADLRPAVRGTDGAAWLEASGSLARDDGSVKLDGALLAMDQGETMILDLSRATLSARLEAIADLARRVGMDLPQDFKMQGAWSQSLKARVTFKPNTGTPAAGTPAAGTPAAGTPSAAAGPGTVTVGWSTALRGEKVRLLAALRQDGRVDTFALDRLAGTVQGWVSRDATGTTCSLPQLDLKAAQGTLSTKALTFKLRPDRDFNPVGWLTSIPFERVAFQVDAETMARFQRWGWLGDAPVAPGRVEVAAARGAGGTLEVETLTFASAEASAQLSATGLRPEAALGLVDGFLPADQIHTVATGATIDLALQPAGVRRLRKAGLLPPGLHLGPQALRLRLRPVPGGWEARIGARTEVGYIERASAADGGAPQGAEAQPTGGGATFALAGAWTTAAKQPLRILAPQAAADAGGWRIDGGLVLDQAAVEIGGAGPLRYVKPKGQACTLAWSGLQIQPAGGLRLDGFDLDGGPLGLALRELAFDPPKDGYIRLALREAALRQPWRGTIQNLLFDPAKNRVRLELDAPLLDLEALAKHAPADLPLRLGGLAREVRLKLDGRLSSYVAGQLHEEVFEAGAALDRLSLRATHGGRTASVQATGRIALTAEQVQATASSIALTAGATGQPARTAGLALSAAAAGRDDLPWLQAAQTDGLPLAITISLRADTAVDLAMIQEARAVFTGALGLDAETEGAGAGRGRPAASAGEAAPFDPRLIRKLQVTLLKADAPRIAITPDLVLATLRLPAEAEQGPGAVLKDRVAKVQSLRVGVHGGVVQLGRSSLDFGGLPKEPLRHDARLSFRDLRLGRLLASREPVEPVYRVAGRVHGAGALKGQGFEGPERRSWDGEMGLQLPDLSVQLSRELYKGERAVQLLAKGLRIGEQLNTLFGGKRIPRELEPLAEPLRTGMIFYAEDFGIFRRRMDFHPFTVQATVRQGVATLRAGTMRGKDGSEGLVLGYSGGVDLATERFAPHLLVWVAGLPVKTQRLIGLHRLPAAEREAILAEFAEGAYRIRLVGALQDPEPRDHQATATRFAQLLQRVRQRVDQLDAGGATGGGAEGDRDATGTPDRGEGEGDQSEPERVLRGIGDILRTFE